MHSGKNARLLNMVAVQPITSMSSQLQLQRSEFWSATESAQQLARLND